MFFRYIALTGSAQDFFKASVRDSKEALREAGMHECLSSGSVSVFASVQTPVLHLPRAGVLIGDLFLTNGTRITNSLQLPETESQEQLRKYILEDCWGQYLLIQPSVDGKHGFAILRDPSPSGDISCIYSIHNGSGFIASDVSLATRLHLYEKQINWNFVAHCLKYPYLKSVNTGLSDISELLPGCTLNLCGTTLTTEQVWSPWEFTARGRRHSSFEQAAEEIRHAVGSVIAALADRDESILLELSGGLDSSIVGACLRGTHARVACCTLVTPVPGADERQYARLVADGLGVELQVEELRYEHGRFDFPLPAHFTTPRIGVLQCAIDAAMEAAADRNEVESYFTGAGGDTVFSYIKTAAPAVDALRERGLVAGIEAVRNLSELHQCTLWKASWLTLRKLLRTPSENFDPDCSFLTPGDAQDFPKSHPWMIAPANALPGDRERISGLATTQLFRESVARGARRRLRMPLLSQPVVEACLRAPCWMWISGGQNRAVARAAFEGLLPPDVLNRRSKGTFMSYLGALYRRNKHQMQTYLTTGSLQAHGLLDTDALQRFIERDLAPRDRTFTRIFDLCMVENWIRQQS